MLEPRSIGSVIPDITMHDRAKDWKHRLSPDRPVYECPKCKEAAMQFFAERPDKPGREDFYYCCACGSTVEV
jgi:hypothetical protein